MKNQKGYSLVEALIAASMVAFIGCTLALGMFQYRKIVASSQLTHVIESQISDIVQNIRPNVGQYQINFDYKAPKEATLDVKKLPMAWTIGLITTVEQCPTCPGRFGYTIQPYPAFKGLYKLTLRVTHTQWKDPRDYVFLVTSK